MRHARIEAEFAAAVTNPDMPVPDWARSPRGDVDARRFAVYRNNVHVGLVSALRAKFPVTARLVGEEFFTAMARAFVAVEKPASPLLAEYGHGFPRFVAGFEPARPLPYLASIAALEIAWLESYHAADAPALGLEDLSALPSDRVLTLSLVRHPAARLVRSDFPVGSIWSANQTDTAASVRSRSAEVVLITRPSVEVELRVITAADHAFCGSLFAGTTVEAAASAALAVAPDFDIGTALVGLIATGAFAATAPEGSLV